jgi:hypothetical protein
MNKADVQRFSGTNRTARQNQIERPAEPDQSWQSHRSAIDQWYSPAPAKHPYNSVFFHHSQIAPESQLESACYRIAGDRRDDRLAQEHSRGPHRTIARRLGAIVIARGDRLEVSASAKGSVVSEENPHVRLRVFIKLPECVCERLCGFPINGIAHFGTV